MASTETTSLAQRPYRGLRQVAGTILAVGIIASICWWIWSSIARHRLQVQIDAITALHQPFWETDFKTAKIPDEQNAAVLWRAGFAALPATDTCPSGSNFWFNDFPPYSAQWNQMEDQSIADNRKLFELAHRAAAVRNADWGPNAHPTIRALVDIAPVRRVTLILSDAVVHAHVHGNDSLAIDRTVDLFQFSRAVEKEGGVWPRLVSIGIGADCFDRLLSITPDLIIAGDRTNPLASGQTGVPREKVEAFIRMLMDERDENRLRFEAIDRERMEEHELLQHEKQSRLALGPMIDLSDARLLAQNRVDRLAAAAPSWTAANGVYQSNPTLLMGLESTNFSRFAVGQQLPPQWAGAYEDFANRLFLYLITDWRGTSARRTAAIALAIRLYREDHQQVWPASLAELVPGYLPSIPNDPFAPAPTQIGYIIRKHATPAGQDRPMLYFGSIGDPNSTSLPPNPTWSWAPSNAQWRDLSRWYPTAASISGSATSSPTTESSPKTADH